MNHETIKLVTGIIWHSEHDEGTKQQISEKLFIKICIQELCGYIHGSNIIGDAAQTAGIVRKTYDLHSGFDLLNHNIPDQLEMIFWHSPYHDIM